MAHPMLSRNIKENFLKDKVTSVKREEDRILAQEKVVKEKEIELERKMKEILDKERELAEWEERLRLRQRAMQEGKRLSFQPKEDTNRLTNIRLSVDRFDSNKENTSNNLDHLKSSDEL